MEALIKLKHIKLNNINVKGINTLWGLMEQLHKELLIKEMVSLG